MNFEIFAVPEEDRSADRSDNHFAIFAFVHLYLLSKRECQERSRKSKKKLKKWDTNLRSLVVNSDIAVFQESNLERFSFDLTWVFHQSIILLFTEH